jgi:hypothetical protein
MGGGVLGTKKIACSSAGVRLPESKPTHRRSRFFEIARLLVCLRHGLGKLLPARGAGASCSGFGFARNPATFDIFNWLQVTANFGDVALLQSAPNRPDYIDVWVLWLHGHDL